MAPPCTFWNGITPPPALYVTTHTATTDIVKTLLQEVQASSANGISWTVTRQKPSSLATRNGLPDSALDSYVIKALNDRGRQALIGFREACINDSHGNGHISIWTAEQFRHAVIVPVHRDLLTSCFQQLLELGPPFDIDPLIVNQALWIQAPAEQWDHIHNTTGLAAQTSAVHVPLRMLHSGTAIATTIRGYHQAHGLHVRLQHPPLHQDGRWLLRTSGRITADMAERTVGQLLNADVSAAQVHAKVPETIHMKK